MPQCRRCLRTFSLEQAKNFTETLIMGDPNEGHFVKGAARQLSELDPARRERVNASSVGRRPPFPPHSRNGGRETVISLRAPNIALSVAA